MRWGKYNCFRIGCQLSTTSKTKIFLKTSPPLPRAISTGVLVVDLAAARRGKPSAALWATARQELLAPLLTTKRIDVDKPRQPELILARSNGVGDGEHLLVARH